MTAMRDRPGDGAESQPDPAGCAGRNAGGAYFSSTAAGRCSGRKMPVADGERLRVTGKFRTPRLRR